MRSLPGRIIEPSGWPLRRGGRALLALCLLAGGPGVAMAQPQGTALDTWLPRLRVGMWVTVEGKRTPDGILEAVKIKVYDGALDEVEVESDVAAVDLGRMTFQTTVGVRVAVTPNTDMEDTHRQRRVSLAFLAVGDRVRIEGQLERDRSLLAQEIDIDKSRPVLDAPEPERQHELTARIESIDSAERRVVVLGLTVQLTEGTRIWSLLPE